MAYYPPAGSPWNYNPYCFSAVASAGTTLTDNTAIKITLGTEEYDYNSNFSSPTYTCPVAGVYHFDGGVTHASASATPVIAYSMIYKNGAEVIRGPSFSAGVAVQNSWNVSGDLLCAAGDTIELYHTQDSAGAEASLNSGRLTFMTGHLVHRTA